MQSIFLTIRTILTVWIKTWSSDRKD